MASLTARISALATFAAQTIKQRAVPAGGAIGQVLAKTAAGDWALAWTNPGAGNVVQTTSSTAVQNSQSLPANVVFTVPSSAGFVVGGPLTAVANGTDYIGGTVTAVTATTVTMRATFAGGNGGTFSAWTLYQALANAAGPQGVAGPGVPTGGTAGQLLRKVTGTDRDTGWTDPPGATAIYWRSGTKGVGANATTDVQLNTLARNDDATRYGTNTSGLVALKAGTYLMTWYMDCAAGGTSSTAGVRTALVQTSAQGTIGEVSASNLGPGNSQGVEIRLSAVRVVKLAANEALYLNAYFTSDGNVLGAAAKDTGLSLTYLGA